jgi:transcriptional regulator with XRE-family HTH domain
MHRIRELREQKGLTQVRLAVAADMNPATLNRIEMGKANPNLKTLERLADALNITVSRLLEDDSPKFQASLPEILEGEEWQRRRNVIMGLHILAAKLHDQWAEELENDSMSAERAGEISFAIEGISHSAFSKTILGGIEQTDRADAKQVRDLMRMLGKLNALLRRTVDLENTDVFLQKVLFDSTARIEDAEKMLEMPTSAHA